MKKDKNRIISVLLAILLLTTFLLPLMSATDEFEKVLETDTAVYGGMTGTDVIDINAIEIIKILSIDDVDSVYDGAQGIITLMMLFGIASAALALYKILKNKGSSTIVFSILTVVFTKLTIDSLNFNEDRIGLGIGYYIQIIAAVAIIAIKIVESIKKKSVNTNV